jgi:hypothetical protein
MLIPDPQIPARLANVEGVALCHPKRHINDSVCEDIVLCQDVLDHVSVHVGQARVNAVVPGSKQGFD